MSFRMPSCYLRAARNNKNRGINSINKIKCTVSGKLNVERFSVMDGYTGAESWKLQDWKVALWRHLFGSDVFIKRGKLPYKYLKIAQVRIADVIGGDFST